MRERYMDLETGITLSLEEVLVNANHKEVLWEAADKMRSFLVEIAEVREDQAELAEKAGATQTTVARIERDAVEPEVTTIRKLAKALGRMPGDLLD